MASYLASPMTIFGALVLSHRRDKACIARAISVLREKMNDNVKQLSINIAFLIAQ